MKVSAVIQRRGRQKQQQGRWQSAEQYPKVSGNFQKTTPTDVKTTTRGSEDKESWCRKWTPAPCTFLRWKRERLTKKTQSWKRRGAPSEEWKSGADDQRAIKAEEAGECEEAELINNLGQRVWPQQMAEQSENRSGGRRLMDASHEDRREVNIAKEKPRGSVSQWIAVGNEGDHYFT